ncbi:uncharacterized protein LOC131285689 [Anopheles ziemanni]|uniref:uncharacterized protein LOC131268363 n=1 Tax=Anopheles coustani TaxID=139045 RepID=UPI0026594D5C|nr:uncharacterized protein LOC131268363 [Anopheles coustani]XP_058170528.1 uncharacterized protein LOC131285689 [Anopheles ziemanni]
MKLELLVLSMLIVISAARLRLKPSPRRDITFPRLVERPDIDEQEPSVVGKPEVEEKRPMQIDPQPDPADSNAAKLRLSEMRRKKVKKVSATRENETTRVTNSSSSMERKLHTKIVHVPEPFVVHVEKPYPVYIEKPIIVEKHIPIKLYITKKESKHR